MNKQQPGHPTLPGNRVFSWFTPARRKPSEYESYTIGQYSSPKRWLDVDWVVRFDDGRPPYSEETTAIKSEVWDEYRDPAQLWQRPYVYSANIEEQALDQLVPAALADGLGSDMDVAWRDQVIGTYLAAWPHVDYGLFLSLAYAEREALADTILFMLAFSAFDRLRHLQDIVHVLFQLQENVPGFSDTAARPAWMEDPMLVPVRRNVELISASEDWFEVAVAINLVFEPLVGGFLKDEFISRYAAHHGDAVSPLVLASARRDTRRHSASTVELVRLVTADGDHAAMNVKTVNHWVSKWSEVSEEALGALGGLFGVIDAPTRARDEAVARVWARHHALLSAAGLATEEGSA